MTGFIKQVFGIKNPDPLPAPTVTEIKTPTVNQEQVDRGTADIMRRRKGAAATMTGASSTGTTAGSVAAKTLLGQ